MSSAIKQSCAGPAAGFTLVELLVALTLLGLLAAVLLGGVQFGRRAWEADDRREDAATRIEIIGSLVRRQMSGALPLVASSDGTATRVAFTGDLASVTFVAPLFERLAVGGLYEVTLSLQGNAGSDGARRLIMQWHPHGGLGLADGYSGEVVLVDRIRAVHFSYFGVTQEERAAGWHDHWSAEARLPSLVRLQIQSISGATPDWPDLVIALRQEPSRSFIF